MRVALRIEVGTSRGLREGVPNLLRLLDRYRVRASFFFALGHDDSGRDPITILRHPRAFGLSSLGNGVLWSGPSLVTRAAQTIRDAVRAGHEVGVCGLSPVTWRRRLAHAEAGWVEEQLGEVHERAAELFGRERYPFATPNWQINPSLFPQLTPGRCPFTTMTRGKVPYFGVLQGQRTQVPELPTTLPTVDEMIRLESIGEDDVHGYLYAASQRVLPAGHVFAARAEFEGIVRLALFEKILVMWRRQDGAVRALGDTLRELADEGLPCHRIGWAVPPGGSQAMATQSVEVPA